MSWSSKLCPPTDGDGVKHGNNMPTSEVGRLLTVGEVADLLQVAPSWVYGRTRRRAVDRIPGFRLGRYWRFGEADVLAWLERQKANG